MTHIATGVINCPRDIRCEMLGCCDVESSLIKKLKCISGG